MCNPAPRTKPKLLVILGAGSSVEQGMPSVGEIDKLMRQWAQEQAKKVEKPDYFGLLWENRECYTQSMDEDECHAAERAAPNYERVLGDLLTLMNATREKPWGDPLARKLCQAEQFQVIGINSSSACFEAIYAQYAELTRKLAEKFRARSLRFLGSERQKFDGYRSLFAALRARFEIGVYNLNHDVAAVTALPDLFTGFDQAGRFQPAEVQMRKGWDFIYHLHGNVHFSLKENIEARDLSDRLRLEWTSLSGKTEFCDVLRSPFYGAEVRGDRRVVVRSTLISGGWKLDQIQSDPFQTFYSTLPRHVHEADAILVGGYSFGDEHVNSILSNRLAQTGGASPPLLALECCGHGLDTDECDQWAFDFRRVVCTELGFFHSSDDPDPARTIERKARNSNPEYQVCCRQGTHVAVWLGGFLAAADRKDEIANRLLRHVPGRSEM